MVENMQSDRVSWGNCKKYRDFAAKSDVLGPLSHIKAEFGRALSGIPTVNYKQAVFQAEPREPVVSRRHRRSKHHRLIVEVDLRPALRDILHRKTLSRRWIGRRFQVDLAAVRALHNERGCNPGSIDNLHQEDSRTILDKLGRSESGLHTDPALS